MIFADEVGITYELRRFPKEITLSELQASIMELWQDPDINGVMVHKPLPTHINEQFIFNHIEPLNQLKEHSCYAFFNAWGLSG